MIVPPCLCLDLPVHILKWPSAVGIDEPEVQRTWYRHGRDLFQYHRRALDISAGEVHMVCFDLEMERCAGFSRIMDALRNCIPVGCNAYMSNKTCQSHAVPKDNYVYL